MWLGLVTWSGACAEYTGEDPAAAPSDAAAADGVAAEGGEPGSDASTPPTPPPYQVRLLADLELRPAPSYPSGFVELGSRAVFFADDGEHGRELWGSGGTEASTIFLADLTVGPAGSDSARLIPWGDKALVVSGGEPTYDGERRIRVHQTDGTPGGTSLVFEIGLAADEWLDASVPLVASSVSVCLGVRRDVNARRLRCFAVDGTPQQTIDDVDYTVAWREHLLMVRYRTEMVDDVPQSIPAIYDVNGAAAPVRLLDGASFYNGVTLADRVLFLGQVLGEPPLLAYFDGVDLQGWDGPAIGVRSLRKAGDEALAVLSYSPTEPVPTQRARLYRTNGTAAGTSFVPDGFGWEPADVRDLDFRHVGTFGVDRLFTVHDPTVAGAVPQLRRQAGDTVPIPLGDLACQNPGPFFNVGGMASPRVLFACVTGGGGYELHVTDGATPAHLLVDLLSDGSGVAGQVARAGESAAFACARDVPGQLPILNDLCLSDGTVSAGVGRGTRLHALRRTGTASLSTDGGAVVGGRLILAARTTSGNDLRSIAIADGAVQAWSPSSAGSPIAASYDWTFSKPMANADSALVLATRGSGVDAASVLLRFVGGDLSRPPVASPEMLGAVVLRQVSDEGAIVTINAKPYWWNGTDTLSGILLADGTAPSVIGASRLGSKVLLRLFGALRVGVVDFVPGAPKLRPLVDVSGGTAGIRELRGYSEDGSAIYLSTDVGVFRSFGEPNQVERLPDVVLPDDGLCSAWHSVGDEFFCEAEYGALDGSYDYTKSGLYRIREGQPAEQKVAGLVRWAKVVQGRLVLAVDHDRLGRLRVHSESGAELAHGVYGGVGNLGWESSASATQLTGDRVFFLLDGGQGHELWESDGTPAGTRQMADIAAGLPSSSPQVVGVDGARVVVLADDRTHGSEPLVLEPSP